MITLEYARELIGDESTNITDDQLKSIIDFLYFVCEKVTDGLYQNKYE